jgi:hypothetical protein
VLGGWGPDRHHRLVVATTDPERLPRLSTWYLLTNLARPAARRAQQTQLGEVVAAYGLRNWVEPGHEQVKDELGWADFQVRGDRAIRRHWTLACLAFSFCWHAGQAQAVAPGAGPVLPAATAAPPAAAARGAQQRLDPGRRHRAGGRRGGVVAAGTTAGAWLAGPVGVAAALLAWMVDQPAAPAVAAGAWLGHGRTADLPPPPAVINKLPLEVGPGLPDRSVALPAPRRVAFTVSTGSREHLSGTADRVILVTHRCHRC